jgi:hypothetical protein
MKFGLYSLILAITVGTAAAQLCCHLECTRSNLIQHLNVVELYFEVTSEILAHMLASSYI